MVKIYKSKTFFLALFMVVFCAVVFIDASPAQAALVQTVDSSDRFTISTQADGTSRNCPTGYVVIGFGPPSAGYNNEYQGVPLICGKLTDAGNASVNTSNQFLYYFIGINNGPKGGTYICEPDKNLKDPTGVMAGARWTKDGQIKYGRCANLKPGAGLLNGEKTVRINWGVTVLCPNNKAAYGFSHVSHKDDAWGYLHCANIIPPSTKISVTSVNAVSGAPVPAWWEFNGPEDPCAVSSCGSPASPISSGVYNDVTPGSYTLNPLGATGGYTLKSIKKVEVAKSPGLFESILGFFGRIVRAEVVKPSKTQMVLAGATTYYIIEWKPPPGPVILPSCSGTPSCTDGPGFKDNTTITENFCSGQTVPDTFCNSSYLVESRAYIYDGGDAESSVTASFTANGSHQLSVNAGDSVTYDWSSTGADLFWWTLSISPGGADACVNTNSSDWGGLPKTSDGNSGPLAVASCQDGYVYTITYTAKNSATGRFASDSVSIGVGVAAPSPPPPVIDPPVLNCGNVSYRPASKPCIAPLEVSDAYIVEVKTNYPRPSEARLFTATGGARRSGGQPPRYDWEVPSACGVLSTSTPLKYSEPNDGNTKNRNSIKVGCDAPVHEYDIAAYNDGGIYGNNYEQSGSCQFCIQCGNEMPNVEQEIICKYGDFDRETDGEDDEETDYCVSGVNRNGVRFEAKLTDEDIIFDDLRSLPETNEARVTAERCISGSWCKKSECIWEVYAQSKLANPDHPDPGNGDIPEKTFKYPLVLGNGIGNCLLDEDEGEINSTFTWDKFGNYVVRFAFDDGYVNTDTCLAVGSSTQSFIVYPQYKETISYAPGDFDALGSVKNVFDGIVSIIKDWARP